MPTGWEQIGMQAAGQATGGIMGLLLGGYNDERQLNQQQDLQNMQIRGQKEMTDYQMMKQMEMWKATNYPAQLAMMKQAGLSPGLIYGKGGGGATTVGNASGSVTGATAASGGGQEIQQMIGLGMQGAMQQAQIENLKANTEKTKAETGNVPLTGANIQAQTQVSKLDAELRTLSLNDMADKIAWETGKALHEMEMAERGAWIQKATMNDKIDTIKGEMLETFLRNAMLKAQTTLTQAQTTQTKAQTRQTNFVTDKILPEQQATMIKGVIQRWKEIENSNRNASTGERRAADDAWINDVQKSTGIPMDILKEAVEGIMRKGSNAPKNTYKEGSNSKGDYWEHTQQY